MRYAVLHIVYFPFGLYGWGGWVFSHIDDSISSLELGAWSQAA
jgi:hypothetical protein